MKDKLKIENDLDYLKELLTDCGANAGTLVMDVFEDIKEEIVILKTVYNIKDK
jgi:hypothetical protein